jgi:hypothetical protein
MLTLSNPLDSDVVFEGSLPLPKGRVPYGTYFVSRLHIWKSSIPPIISPPETPLDEITSSIRRIIIAVSVAD